MNVTQSTPEFLTLDEKPWLVGLLIFGMGLLFGAIGVAVLMDGEPGGVGILVVSASILFAGYWVVERTQIVFNRPESYVEFRKISLRRTKVTRYELNDVDSTAVEERKQLSGNSKLKVSRINLVLNEVGGQRYIPFTSSLSTGDEASWLSPKINVWLASEP